MKDDKDNKSIDEANLTCADHIRIMIEKVSEVAEKHSADKKKTEEKEILNRRG